jgi:hypothetical protein
MNKIITFGQKESMYMPTLSMHRWDKYLAPIHGTWSVICQNNELAYMQGVQTGNVHLNCIVDDFGNLVRKE